MEKLRPCVFCGSNDLEIKYFERPGGYSVVCNHHRCEAYGPYAQQEQDAISKWNARPAEGALVHILDRLINELPTKRDWFDPDLEAQAHAALKAAKGE